jgi:hypothetical protein
MFTNVEAGNAGNHPGPVVNSASEVAGPSKKRKIDPALKAWIDNVIVPALVQQYLAECDSRQDNGRNPISERVQ